MIRWLPILSLLFAAGCNRYQYIIVDPPDLAQTIGHQQDEVFTTTAAEYHLRGAEDRLVMRIFNTSQSPMRLDGSRSIVVAPDGQSHPLISQSIAPESFIKLVFPPYRPTVDSDYSGIHYGVYWSSGDHDHWHGSHHGGRWEDRGERYRRGRHNYYSGYNYGGLSDSGSDRTVYDDSNPIYWDWRGETEMSLTLVFEQDGQVLQDRFVIRRERLK